MTKKEKLAQLKSELIDMRDAVADMDAKSIEKAEAKQAEFEKLSAEVKKADALEAKLNGIGSTESSVKKADSLGSYAVEALQKGKKSGRCRVTTPEFKANTDTAVEGTTFDTGLTDVKKEILPLYQRPLIVDTLFNHETISGKFVEYYMGEDFEGSPAAVAENAKKPQIHMQEPTKVTDPLCKIASFTKVSDEMLEDVPYMTSYINNRAIYVHGLQKEAQVLNGNGTDPNIKGLLNRDGILKQAITAARWTVAGDLADAIIDAKMDIMQNSGFLADGIVINPADYKVIRKGKDSNGQYYGGGYIYQAYGNGAVPQFVENIWGIPTYVSPAVQQGKIIVGAFKIGASIFNKQGGGLRVEIANQNEDDFTYNRATVRVEERLGLAVYYPKAFKVLESNSTNVQKVGK